MPEITSPFVDKTVKLFVAGSRSPEDGQSFFAGRIRDHVGDFVLVAYPDLESRASWVNLRHILEVEVAAESPAADPHAPAVDAGQVSEALAAFKAHPGPLVDTGA